MLKDYQTVTLRIQGDIAVVTLNRPDKKNAMSFLMMAELMAVAKQLKADRQCRAVIIQGADGNFSSGIDLADLNNPKRLAWVAKELIKPAPSIFQAVCLVWQKLPVPVIAVVDGVCLGAGLQLALGADFRIASPDSRFGLLESKWGLVSDMGISQTGTVIPADKLKQLMMTAEMVDAHTALSMGVISTVSDDAYQAALKLTAQISARSPDAVLAAKRVSQAMTPLSYCQLYQEKLWQMRLLVGKNRKLAIKKAKDSAVKFLPRQY